MTKKELDPIVEAALPVIYTAENSYVLSRALLNHYVKSMSQLLKKSEDDIRNEINARIKEESDKAKDKLRNVDEIY